ncbi:uncharacterized protein LOC132642784 [Lycium barbarum]|uniref:uncharacterized protein LOC132642784 n=1 Tax=Lycium barbarum TaxID=112863 RepID=UPI00293EA731|nr:uncharacterized protein LOC132642784 [Lycium barbarum]
MTCCFCSYFSANSPAACDGMPCLFKVSIPWNTILDEDFAIDFKSLIDSKYDGDINQLMAEFAAVAAAQHLIGSTTKYILQRMLRFSLSERSADMFCDDIFENNLLASGKCGWF